LSASVEARSDSQYRLQQLAANNHCPLSRVEKLVGLWPVRRGQHYSAEQCIRREERRGFNPAETHVGENLPDRIGIEIQSMDAGCRRLLRAFPERLRLV